MPVPLPDEGHTLTQALMKAVLLRSSRRQGRQASFDFMELARAQAIETRWQDAAEKAKRNRTVFAQRRLKPEDVLPEWQQVARRARREGGRAALHRPGARAARRWRSSRCSRGFKAPLGALPEDVRERLEAEGLSGSLLIDFDYPPAPRLPARAAEPSARVGARRDAARAHARRRRRCRRRRRSGCARSCRLLGVADGCTARTLVALAAAPPPARRAAWRVAPRLCSSRRRRRFAWTTAARRVDRGR